MSKLVALCVRFDPETRHCRIDSGGLDKRLKLYRLLLAGLTNCPTENIVNKNGKYVHHY